MTTSAFPKIARQQLGAASYKDATLRDFSGGLRIVESDVTLKSNFATVLKNMFVNEDYSQTLRFGTKLFATLAANAIEIIYFNNVYIACLFDGRIQAINAAGTVTTIWSTAIAAALPGAPAGWSNTATHIDSTEDGGQLIITNNVDKPVIISAALSVTYLQDLLSMTNINVPIGRHITMVDGFCVMAHGTEPEIYISSRYASGTWQGDPAPNDGMSKRLGSYIGKGASRITAVTSFRNRLFVFFSNAIIVMQLGIFDADGNHTPEVIDVVDGIGAVSHRGIFNTEREIIFLSTDGIYKASKQRLEDKYDTTCLSEQISPLIYANLPKVGSAAGYSFCVADRSKNKLFFAITRQDNEVLFLAMSHDKNFSEKSISWSQIEGWEFKGGSASALKRVHFFNDNKIYQYGNNIFDGEEFYADLIDDVSADGNEITFDWEFPWLDTNERVRTKVLKKIQADTIGTAEFFLQVFVDKFYKQEDEYVPALEMKMRAGSSSGFGLPSVGFGGGRRISDERQYGFPVKFKIMKIRIKGATREKLLVNAISMVYATGNYNR